MEIWKSRKVAIIFALMKTIKVSDMVHLELKRFVADNPGLKMDSIAGYSIMVYLKTKGHKFIKPEVISTKKTSKTKDHDKEKNSRTKAKSP